MSKKKLVFGVKWSIYQKYKEYKKSSLLCYISYKMHPYSSKCEALRTFASDDKHRSATSYAVQCVE